MTENQVPAWTPHGDLTAVPHANDNVPQELRALGAAIGKETAPVHWYDMPANDNLPPVVAFTGVAGSGKSTATKYLVERHGYTLVKFAGPLKDMMRAIGMAEDEIEGSYKETAFIYLCGKTPRHAMQTLGTEWGRNCIGDDFWINLWRRRVEQVFGQAGRVVVDDCRFPNEAQAIRRLGGDIFKIEGRGGIAGSHVSERGCGDHDLVIANGGELDELYEKVEGALRRFG
ncbi:deoxynucleotide monophosphate kinase [Rhizobium phaseoli]|uniref:deoxynucleotide monophosphate kinase family protein n=1 Tax=Rhizobium phaseoli TaxID=396 RepID=UPI00255387AA|nr:deoxynucleotide monophosphate kinase [Rhizobium phaseoli]MDK4725659.1 deoxynucleotide monophosphate kinase [Rhizobium phaseoli]